MIHIIKLRLVSEFVSKIVYSMPEDEIEGLNWAMLNKRPIIIAGEQGPTGKTVLAEALRSLGHTVLEQHECQVITIGSKKNTTAENSDVELIITPDDVQTINPSKGAVAKLSKPLIEWLRVHGNPHQTIVIDCGGVRVVADETYAPFETIE